MGEGPDDDRQHHSCGHRRFEELDGDRHRRRDGREGVRQREDSLQREDNAVHIVERGVRFVGGVGVVGVLNVNVMRSVMAVHHQFVMVMVGGFMNVRCRRQRQGGEAYGQDERCRTREPHHSACYVSRWTAATEVFLKSA